MVGIFFGTKHFLSEYIYLEGLFLQGGEMRVLLLREYLPKQASIHPLLNILSHINYVSDFEVAAPKTPKIVRIV